MSRWFNTERFRPTFGQVFVSLLIVALGLTCTRALSQVNEDLRVMYTEYTLAASDLAHISADVIRFRTTVIRAVEAPTKMDFERITASLPEQRARIQHAVDRYASASLRVSRSGRSEPEDIQALRASLDAYFVAASKTISLLVLQWSASTPQEAAELRNKAEHHAADNAGPKLVQVSLAVDRLLDTVAEVAKDMRDEGTRDIRYTTTVLLVGSFAIAFLNLFTTRRQPSDRPSSDSARSIEPERVAPPVLSD
jgi:hypothetical protein